MIYAYNTPLYEHTTFYTHTKYLVRIHKLSVHVEPMLNGYTPFVHMHYGCVRVLVQNTILHVKRALYAYNIWYTYKILCTQKTKSLVRVQNPCENPSLLGRNQPP